MAAARACWLIPFLKDTGSFATFTLGTVIGVLGIAAVADMPVFPGYFQTEWSKVIGIGTIGFVGLFSSIVALRNRRRAGLLLLGAAPIVGSCFAWWLRESRYDSHISVMRLLLIFAVASAPLGIPGAFWFATSRAGWEPVLRTRLLSKRAFQVLGGGTLAALGLCAALLLSFYLPKGAWVDWGHEYAPLGVPQFADQAVFTADPVFAGENRRDPRFCTWMLMHVQHRFWGLSRWNPNFVVVKGFSRFEKGEYLVDAQTSQGLLTHFLPFVELYSCSHTAPAHQAIADLRALNSEPPTSGVRILGTVYTDMFVTSEPARDMEVIVSGPKGSLSIRTDEQGIYDLIGPEGHYSITIGPQQLRGFRYTAEADVKSGQVWGATLIAHSVPEHRND